MGLKETTAQSLKLPEGVGLYRQTYDAQPQIEGAIQIAFKVFYDDWGGFFKEVIRTDEDGNVISLLPKIKFKPTQSNVSYIAPHSERAWHIHPEQSEIWSVAVGMLILGLIDYRQDSNTLNIKSKHILTPERGIFIPAGVAHGFINPTDKETILNYFTSHYFTPGDDTQELRILPTGELKVEWLKPESI